MDALTVALSQDLSAIRAEVRRLKWMFGLTWGLLILLLGGLAQLMGRLR